MSNQCPLVLANSPPGTLLQRLRSVPLSITLDKLIPVVLGVGMDLNAVLRFVFLVHLAVMHSLKLISMLKLYTADLVMWN